MAPGVPYRSTSMDEVLEIRNAVQAARDIEEVNKFIKAKLPKYINVDERVQEIVMGYTKPKCDAY